MSRILIIRFSSLGDVAMTVPVIDSFAKQYPMHKITVLSRPVFSPLFKYMPDNVCFLGVDLKSEFKGVRGLEKLFRKLYSEHFDYVADFHSVLRTYYLVFRFRIRGTRVAVIDKGYKEKKQLTRKKNKNLNPLKSNFTRYKEVLDKLGFSFEYSFNTIFNNKSVDLPQFKGITSYDKNDDEKWIGIAPFARHKEKIYPLELQEKVIAHFIQDKRTKVFLFGGGKEEAEIAASWKAKYPSLISTVGKLKMEEELALMSHLDLMYSMDSANMHLASLVGTKVISLWGATHPYVGFMGWGQAMDNALQIDLYCRPCSIAGMKSCYRGDYACLHGLKPDVVIAKIDKELYHKI